MNKKIISMLIVGTTITLSGCALKMPTYTPSPSTDTIISGDVQEPLTNTLPGPANEYTLLFSGTRTESLTVYHTANEEIKVYFINSDAKKLNVKISFPDNVSRNLRRSHVIMPDGQQDGPFGTEMEYDLTQLGGYQLIFSENMMAEGPRSGDAQITMTLE